MIRKGNLELHARHEVRIIAPMVGDSGVETLQVEGLWIDEGGQLLPFDSFSTKHPTTDDGLADATGLAHPEFRKMLEIVTDLPGSMTGRDRHKATGRTRAILGGVMGWEYLLGEMFGVDHVTVGMDGMCLIQDCVGGRGSPAGLADVFFQRLSASVLLSNKANGAVYSGPLGSAQYSQPWLFEGYVPEVMVCQACSPLLSTNARFTGHEYWQFRLGFLPDAQRGI